MESATCEKVNVRFRDRVESFFSFWEALVGVAEMSGAKLTFSSCNDDKGSTTALVSWNGKVVAKATKGSLHEAQNEAAKLVLIDKPLLCYCLYSHTKPPPGRTQASNQIMKAQDQPKLPKSKTVVKPQPHSETVVRAPARRRPNVKVELPNSSATTSHISINPSSVSPTANPPLASAGHNLSPHQILSLSPLTLHSPGPQSPYHLVISPSYLPQLLQSALQHAPISSPQHSPQTLASITHMAHAPPPSVAVSEAPSSMALPSLSIPGPTFYSISPQSVCLLPHAPVNHPSPPPITLASAPPIDFCHSPPVHLSPPPSITLPPPVSLSFAPSSSLPSSASSPSSFPAALRCLGLVPPDPSQCAPLFSPNATVDALAAATTVAASHTPGEDYRSSDTSGIIRDQGSATDWSTLDKLSSNGDVLEAAAHQHSHPPLKRQRTLDLDDVGDLVSEADVHQLQLAVVTGQQNEATTWEAVQHGNGESTKRMPPSSRLEEAGNSESRKKVTAGAPKTADKAATVAVPVEATASSTTAMSNKASTAGKNVKGSSKAVRPWSHPNAALPHSLGVWSSGGETKDHIEYDSDVVAGASSLYALMQSTTR